MKSNRMIFASAVLVIVTLACNFSGSGSESNTPASSEETVQVEANETTGGANQDTVSTDDIQSGTNEEDKAPDIGSISSGEPLDLDNPLFEIEPDIFNTYRASLNYSFSAPNGITGTILMEGTTQLEPYGTSLVFQTSGKAVMGTEEDMFFTQFDGREYIYSPDFGCITGLIGQQGNPFEIAMDTYGILSGQAAYTGEETVNGIETFVYKLTEQNINPLDEADLGIRNLSEGWIYIAQDGKYIVRVLLSGTGVNEGLSQDAGLEGSVHYELNFFDFDAPINFEIPEGCQSSSAPQIPLPEDAAEITQFDNIYSFTTELTLDEARAFYENEMPSLGCSDPEVVGDGSSMVSMNFINCDTGSIQIILTSEANGKTLGTIFNTP